jgi:hypothetical protein
VLHLSIYSTTSPIAIGNTVEYIERVRNTEGNEIMKLNAGDRVAFKASFCRNTGRYTGFIPFARGTITEIEGPLAYIEFEGNHSGGPCTMDVLLSNLVREDRIHLEPA